MNEIEKILFLCMAATAVIGTIYTIAEKFIRKFLAGKYHIREKIRTKIKKSDKLMSWLYGNKKSLSEQVYEEFCNAQVSFIRTDWRN